MNHLKAPETAKMTIDIGAKDTGVLSDLSQALAKLSSMQHNAISSGFLNARDIAHEVIIEGELDEE